MNKMFIVAVLLSVSPSFAVTAPGTITLQAHDMAAVLAGMSPHSVGVYADWKANRPNSRVNIEQQTLIKEFSRTQLSDAYRDSETVFYPFGAADVIFPSFFFPNMKTLILAGLEKPKVLPERLAVNSIPGRVAKIRAAFGDLFYYGYYVTSKMNAQFAEYGTSTMIAIQLVMLGNHIVKVEAGPFPESSKITYKTPQNDERYVYYFYQNLADGSITQPFIDFVKSMKFKTTFYKASSYLPHRPEFSKVNELALSAKYFVQSDTGMKMAAFTPAGGWKVHLFGQYITPHSMFGTQVQAELAYAYAAAICKSKDQVAIKNFMAIWMDRKTHRSLDPCSVGRSDYGDISVYEGALPFRYDYAGQLGNNKSLNLRNIGSSFIYAVRESTPPPETGP